jgi:ATP-dependent RNA helicase DeaD
MVPYPRRRAAERTLQFASVKVTWKPAPTADDIRAKDKERLMTDPVFAAELEPEELAIARELLEQQGADKVAAAFVKLYQSRLPPPEDVSEATQDNLQGRGAGERGGRVSEIRGKFDAGVWFRLSLGHKHRADPRWLLPMICRAGHVTKKEVGAIKIFQNETRFEIDGAHAERYAAVIKKDGTGEDNVTISLLDARGGKAPPPPSEDRPRRGPPRDRKPQGRRRDAPDYETMGAEDKLESTPRPKRPARDFAPKAKKRRRSDDGEAAAQHPAYEPLDMKALAPKTEGAGERTRATGQDERPARKPSKGKKPFDKKKPKKNKPSRAARKDARAKQG